MKHEITDPSKVKAFGRQICVACANDTRQMKLDDRSGTPCISIHQSLIKRRFD